MLNSSHVLRAIVLAGCTSLGGCANVWGFQDLTTSDGGAAPDVGAASGQDASNDSAACTIPPTATCGLAPQCGCASNQTCDITDDATGAAACNVAGSAAQGHGCNASADCSPGLTCFQGACRPYCTTSNAQCNLAGTGLCIQVTATGGVNLPNKTLCLINCQVDDPTSCGGIPASGPIAGCTLETIAGTHGDCTAAGRSTTTCGGFDGATWVPPVCAPGYTCSSTNTCNQWCRFNVGGTCTGGMTCQHYPNGGVAIDGSEYGYCA